MRARAGSRGPHTFAANIGSRGVRVAPHTARRPARTSPPRGTPTA